MRKIVPYIEKKLFLKVNQEKTEVAYIGKVKFLGFSFYKHKSGIRVRVHPKAIAKMKVKVGEHTQRNNRYGNVERTEKLKKYIQGWINYFKIADMKMLLIRIDEWMRRRIRMVYWKQWKKVKTRYRMLKHYRIKEWKAWEYANTRKGYWRIANSPILSRTLDNQTLKNLGYLNLSDYYRKVNVN